MEIHGDHAREREVDGGAVSNRLVIDPPLTIGELANCYEESVSICSPDFFGLPGNSRDWPKTYGTSQDLTPPPGWVMLVDAENDPIAMVPSVAADTIVRLFNKTPRILEKIEMLKGMLED